MTTIPNSGPVLSTESDLDLPALLAAQRKAHLDSPEPSAKERQDRIDRIIGLMTSEAHNLVQAVRADYGSRSEVQSYISEILGPLPSIKHTRKNLHKWMRPRRVGAGPLGYLGARAWIQYQPLGVVGVISPWNFPVGLAFDPVAQAFAAGNRVMLKLSEHVPQTSEVMQEAISRWFAPEELVAVTGGPTVGAAFGGLPFDHLLLTGAGSTGKLVQRAAAENLVPVTLELGGKCPVVIGPNADLRQVAERVIAGKTMNAGQLCMAPDHVYVPVAREQELVTALETEVRRRFPTMLHNDDYTSIVNEAHRRRIEALVHEAAEQGADVVGLSPTGEDFANQQGQNKVPFTLVRNAKSSMAVMQEEIFGPVLPILTFDRYEEVYSSINAGDRPLAAYWFGPSCPEQKTFLRRTVSGGVTINDIAMHYTVADLPFGGVGASGMGRYHGRAGFETFSNLRGVLQAPKRVSLGAAMGAPYEGLRRRAVEFQVKREIGSARRKNPSR